ncbi:MAG: M14 family metallopeptidase [Bacteroidaceae bacterium]|nr:M14 family metallopeptidase [Bacteroidaceae bacterium]
MIKDLIFSMESPYRDTFRIWGYRFGSGEKSLAIVGAMRGDEVKQQFICAQLVAALKELESQGKLIEGHEILVIPSANPFSMNIGKRFWALDGTDINRMFPGYDLGETTQRIASGLFEAIKEYRYGIQMASSYMSGNYVPHVRITKTGFEDVDTARLFGLPYVSLRDPKPFDTVMLNYNWQIWSTKAYSLYGGKNDDVTRHGSRQMVDTLLRFINRCGLSETLPNAVSLAYESLVIDDAELVKINAPAAGILQNLVKAGDTVVAGQPLARIIDPYENTTLAQVDAPRDGVVFYTLNKPLALQHTPLFEIY